MKNDLCIFKDKLVYTENEFWKSRSKFYPCDSMFRLNRWAYLENCFWSVKSKLKLYTDHGNQVNFLPWFSIIVHAI
jgi:hypothetical protein